MALINNNKLYDVLKYVTIIAAPAALTFYGLVANTLGLSHTQEVMTIGAGAITFLGTLVGISSSQYKKSK